MKTLTHNTGARVPAVTRLRSELSCTGGTTITNLTTMRWLDSSFGAVDQCVMSANAPQHTIAPRHAIATHRAFAKKHNSQRAKPT